MKIHFLLEHCGESKINMLTTFGRGRARFFYFYLQHPIDLLLLPVLQSMDS